MARQRRTARRQPPSAVPYGLRPTADQGVLKSRAPPRPPGWLAPAALDAASTGRWPHAMGGSSDRCGKARECAVKAFAGRGWRFLDAETGARGKTPRCAQRWEVTITTRGKKSQRRSPAQKAAKRSRARSPLQTHRGHREGETVAVLQSSRSPAAGFNRRPSPARSSSRV